MHTPPSLWAVMVVRGHCPLSLFLIHLTPPPPLIHQHTAARNCSITAVLTPVYESRLGTFKSKVTASEAFNLNLKGSAPPLTLTPPCCCHLHLHLLLGHLLDHPVPPRHLHCVRLCVCVCAHLSWMNVRPHGTL